MKGDVPCPAPGEQWESLIIWPVGAHSAKPECFLVMIEQYFPNLPKIELNRRGGPRPGWDAWGNEAAPKQPEKGNAADPQELAEARKAKNAMLNSSIPTFLRREAS